MNTISLQDVLKQIPSNKGEEYSELYELWQMLDKLFSQDNLDVPMDAVLDQKIIAKLTPREKHLYVLPQNELNQDVAGLRSGDLAPRHKNLTTILMARQGRVIEAEWDRID